MPFIALQERPSVLQMLWEDEVTIAEMCLALHLAPTKESFKKACASLRQIHENMILY